MVKIMLYSIYFKSSKIILYKKLPTSAVLISTFFTLEHKINPMCQTINTPIIGVPASLLSNHTKLKYKWPCYYITFFRNKSQEQLEVYLM